jgi:hypothetical protein
MVDRYTRAVLTVIAAALVALAVERDVGPAKAQGANCGERDSSPCYVAVEIYDSDTSTWSLKK